ncbi:metal-dependent hydrolase [Halorientalis pallida]|uniref:Metal-dependent hydrolase n=1 Tax=Halorientalis pallida TaxID=2479928 RepID=A0A498KXS7_9EURY|nr:metal-dependent hydrolase [Halorientalis pallida]RXK46925.1 metal-dependent hydrolase [Halorientalis pallida]
MPPLDQLSWVLSQSASGAILFTYTFENVAWALVKHLATGYLLYSILQRVRGRRLTVATVVAALVGSLGPDLIDKPLTLVGVLGYGRTFAHSLFTTAVILTAGFVLARRVDRTDLSGAFAVGYLSHLLVDMFGEVFGGLPYVDTAFLFWPVVVKRPIGLARPTLPVPKATIFLAIVVFAAVLWVLDGMVGLSDTARFVRHRLREP